MKNFCKMLLTAAISFAMGAWLHKCQPSTASIPGQGCVSDTSVHYDTIPYIEPKPASTAPLGRMTIAVPNRTRPKKETDTLPLIMADTEVGEIGIEAIDTDSVKLTLPIVQNVYEDTAYRAYVSGVCPRLDSIFVYPRTAVVTIKKPPKRWHIGPTVGYGLTPQGLRPYAGISITYSVISF